MPKLDDTHLIDRIAKQIDKVEKGQTLILRDIKAVLSDAAFAQVEAEWIKQQNLRKGRRARGNEERAELGWISKRDLFLAALKAELTLAKSNAGAVWKKKQQDAKVRQARIYFDALSNAEKTGKTKESAKNWANNELTRAGLRRMDGADTHYTSRRDTEVNEIEDVLRDQLKTDEDREQERLLEQQNAMDRKTRKRGGRKKKLT
jgi:hypothetical protein